MATVWLVFKRTFHWGPLITIGLITIILSSATYCLFQLSVLPRVVVFKGIHNVLCYTWVFLILKNFFQAMAGPNFLPFKWEPKNPKDKSSLQFCKLCEGYKAPRSHHCKLCRRCVPKMDHHCPWVNTCVGHSNHAAFTRFVFYAPLGCLHAAVINANFLYRLFTYEYRNITPRFPISEKWIFFTIIGGTLGIGVSIAVTILFAVQIKGILQNMTQIEEWIVEKAHHRRLKQMRQRFSENEIEEEEEEEEEEDNSKKGKGKGKGKKKTNGKATEKDGQKMKRKAELLKPFVYPYNLGWKRNFTQVINWSGRPVGDGRSWTLREGCTQFDLTLEQLAQKKEKLLRTYEATIAKEYKPMACCELRYGLKAWLSSPCTLMEGEKIPVLPGNVVHITSWKSHWYYGNRLLNEEESKSLKRVKGWFPKKCIDPETFHKIHSKTD